MSVIYVGADHRGLNFKNKVVEFLRDQEYKVKDLGPVRYDQDDDYSDMAIKLAEKVVSENTKGILICGSGVGVCISANKVDGARAALATSEKQARLARTDDDVNILCLSADLVDEEINFKIIETFLETVFASEEKYIRRINKIKKYEKAKLG
ncbi:MAG: RpiB/LacA/LacB family sugar-phosphate isomerase [Candidatus Shapirobacteria bacterium]|nr:RpiB/LacA/LacB family sugar-phosphate isomerase [Candidatus Shapirobacteria bacterium]MDD4383046.1 RpiB/LacA/LacB family sugar-phosphate isomerase [Candidatus Shapirobacteria bacterium]